MASGIWLVQRVSVVGEDKMSRYVIEVEIPDGEFCSGGVINSEISCNYVGDSTASSAGICALINEGDCLLYFEDKINWRIIKHKDCPSNKLHKVIHMRSPHINRKEKIINK